MTTAGSSSRTTSPVETLPLSGYEDTNILNRKMTNGTGFPVLQYMPLPVLRMESGSFSPI